MLSVIGLGYVGYPLAESFTKCGFFVYGIDIDERKVKEIAEQSKAAKNIHIGSDFRVLEKSDIIFICVPTPLDSFMEPDLRCIYETTDMIKKYMRKGQAVILESTTYPETTESILLPEFESKGLKVGRDFYLAFSPERIDPGNKQFTLKDIPKIVGGVTKKCSEVAREIYQFVTKDVFVVSSPSVAEMAKLLENIFRSVNIALVNELAMLCNKMGVDIFEVIRAAATKPFGYMPFYPGPGLGGHCIPVDPFYLSYIARKYDFQTKFIELAGEVNTRMPYYVVARVQDILNLRAKSLRGSKVLVLGTAYKKDVDDVRNSPGIKIIELLNQKGAEVMYNDPYVGKVNVESDVKILYSQELDKSLLKSCDICIITTDHKKYLSRWKEIVENSELVFDTRGTLKRLKTNYANRHNIFSL